METFVIHPFHEHGLLLRKLSRMRKLRSRVTLNRGCLICKGYDVNVSSYYCCEECDIFIHCECVTLPLQLQHPFHSDHPIKLLLPGNEKYCRICRSSNKTSAYRYSCECELRDFCLSCVTLTLLLNEEEEKEEVEVAGHLPQHNHPLSLFNVTMRRGIECKVCREAIHGPVYVCRICLFAMHESCAQLPKKMIQHPFHPQHPLTLLYSQEDLGECRACGESYGTNYRYCCESSECNDFNLHAHCAALKLPPPDWKPETLISSPIHQHPLMSFPSGIGITNIRCRVCTLYLGYSDEVYCCLDCIVVIHKKCTEIPQQLIHPIHPKHPLTFLSDTNSHFCGHCTYYKGFDFGFNCKYCEFYLCIKCAFDFLANGDKVMSLDFKHLAHQHPLTLRPSQGDTTAGEFCTVCTNREAPVGSSRLYGCNTCDGFSIHESCVSEVSEILSHPFHPSHSLKRITFHDQEYERCSGCFCKIWPKHSFYHCAQCSFYLCGMDCAFNEYPTINHQPHMHELTYFSRVYLPKLLCNYCGITCTADLYRCVECNFSLHHDCASLPLTAIDEYHHHELSLCAKALGDYADKKEFNCSHCQCSRDPKLGVYACEPCHYYVHIHCMVPEERGKRKKVADTVCRKWDTKMSTQEAKVEKLREQLNKAEEEFESMKIEKELEIEDLAVRDDIDEL